MTVRAGGFDSVFRRVAVPAGQGAVFCLRRAEKVCNDLVTHAAVLRRRRLRIAVELRHMCLVAEIASTGDLSLMRLVALKTRRDLPMDIVALRTIEGGMLALELSEFPALQSVAHKTGILPRPLQ
jgi:hypothetical protein